MSIQTLRSTSGSASSNIRASRASAPTVLWVNDTYTHGHHESVLRSHQWRTIANSAAYLEPFLVPGRTLLDVGCGPGTITVEFADRLAPGEVIGTDLGADVVEQAAATIGDRTNVGFEVGDGYRLSYDDDSFDIVHAHQVLQHVTDPVGMLRELNRVCKPGGVIAVRDADYAAMSWYPELPALDGWMQTYRSVARHNGADPDAARKLLSWASAAGLSDVTPSATVWCFATEADRQWWGGLWADRVRESSMATQAIDYGFANRDDLERYAAAFAEWTQHPDSWFLVPNGELLCRPAK